MLRETHDFDVIHFPQRKIHGQFMVQRHVFLGVWNRIVRVNVSDQSVLFVRHVSHHCIGWKQAGRRCVRVGGVAGQKEMLSQVQQSQVPPVAGVKFLSVKQ